MFSGSAFSELPFSADEEAALGTASGSLSATDPIETLSGAGSVDATAALAATDDVETLSGFAGNPVSSSGAVTDDVETLAGAATSLAAGSGAVADDVETLSAAGSALASASLSKTDPVETMAALAVMSGNLIHGRMTDPIERLNGDARVTGTGTPGPAIEITNKLLPPPRLVNDPARDVVSLSRWCSTLYDHLVGTYNVLGEITTLVRALRAAEGDQTNVATEFLRVLSEVEQLQNTLAGIIQNQE